MFILTQVSFSLDFKHLYKYLFSTFNLPFALNASGYVSIVYFKSTKKTVESTIHQPPESHAKKTAFVQRPS